MKVKTYEGIGKNTGKKAPTKMKVFQETNKAYNFTNTRNDFVEAGNCMYSSRLFKWSFPKLKHDKNKYK